VAPHKDGRWLPLCDRTTHVAGKGRWVQVYERTATLLPGQPSRAELDGQLALVEVPA
jgi:hypothetical protein